jgi:carbamate kinase
MISQPLQNALMQGGVDRPTATIVTQVLVDENDPAIAKPTKYIGQFYSMAEALELAERNDWSVKEDPGRGWRRVVPSPSPIGIVESGVISRLVVEGVIVICCGGGGIPVYRLRDGRLEGFDAVIDKDRASAVLAHEIGADLLIILTDVEQVALDFATDQPRPINRMTADEARGYLDDGQFPKGSMGPKIEAAVDFIRRGGRQVIITSILRAHDAVRGHGGTQVVA